MVWNRTGNWQKVPCWQKCDADIWSWNHNRSQEIRPVVCTICKGRHPKSTGGEFSIWFNSSWAPGTKLHHTGLLYYNQVTTCKDKVNFYIKLATNKQDRSKIKGEYAQDSRSKESMLRLFLFEWAILCNLVKQDSVSHFCSFESITESRKISFRYKGFRIWKTPVTVNAATCKSLKNTEGTLYFILFLYYLQCF